jgi:hypothetical protein
MKEHAGGYAYAFTLNLSPRDQARSKQKSPWLYNAITRKIGRDVPLLVAFGADKRGRIHAHGAYAAGNDVQAIAIAAAIMGAGQPFENRTAEVHRYQQRALGDAGLPPGKWGGYIRDQNLVKARRLMSGGRLWNSTHIATRLAKELHAEIRTRVNTAAGFPPTTRAQPREADTLARHAELKAQEQGLPMLAAPSLIPDANASLESGAPYPAKIW